MPIDRFDLYFLGQDVSNGRRLATALGAHEEKGDKSMSMTPEEAAIEEGMDILFREWEREHANSFREEGVSNFEHERIASYFKSFKFDPLILKRMEESKNIKDISPTASFILFYSCIEIMLKNELFTPVVYAFTTNDNIARYFANHIVQFGMPPRHIGDLVDGFLAMTIELETSEVKIAGITNNFWKHIESKQKIRNKVVHSTFEVNEKDLDEMDEMACFILNRVCIPLRNELLNWD